MTLFDILRMNERILVWTDEETGLIYTWNQSLTLQAWKRDPEPGSNKPGHSDYWEEVDILTLDQEPAGFHDARNRARRWALEG